MAGSKVAYESFTQNWQKTVQWANANKIPYSAYYPIYQMDSRRLLSGTPMSEAERIRAIEASAGLNYSTALPTDQPAWTDVRGNAIRNAQDIFTGLEPTHIIPNVVDTIKGAFTHPGDIFGAIGDLFSGNLGAAAKQVLHPDNILQWVPGVYDLATVFNADPHLKGAKGVEALAHNPITSVLDVLPFGRVLSEGLGRTALGSSIADHVGLTTAELRKAGLWRVGGKLIKSVPVNGLLEKANHPFLNSFADPETGMRSPTGINANVTTGDMWEYYKSKIGAGSEEADIVQSRIARNAQGRELVRQYLKPAFDLFSKLTQEQRDALTRWSQVDFRPLAEKMADGRVPIELRNAFAAAWEWSQKFQELAMQSGEAVKIMSPLEDEAGNITYVEETYWVNTDQYRNLQSAMDRATSDQRALDTAKQPFMELLYQMDELDRNMFGVFEVLDNSRTAIYDSIKRSIPQEESSTAADRLRSTLPEGERWDRAVTEQTPLIRNLLGLENLPPSINDAALRMFPSLRDIKRELPKITLHQVNDLRDLFAPGGLLDQAREAYRDQDWVKLNAVTKAAVRKFNNSGFKDIPTNGAATLFKIKRMTENLQKYAATRQKMAEDVNKMATGYYRGRKMGKDSYRKSISYLSVQADRSQKAWIEAAIQNPPDVWRNAAMDGLTTKLAQSEITAENMDKTIGVLSEQGWNDSQLTRLRRNDRNIIELMVNANKGTLENAMLPDIDHGEYNRVTEDQYRELASLRARGHQPLYVPSISTRDIDRGEATYDVYIRGVAPRRPSATYGKVWGYTPSIYSLEIGMLKATKEVVEKDMMDQFVNQELIPRLYKSDEIQATVANYYKTEIDNLNIAAEEGKPVTEHTTAIIQRGIERLGLVKYSPELVGIGREFGHPNLNAEYYINANLAKTFKQTIDTFQFPAQKMVDRGTQLFRFSILGLSPRYTAHILFGGTFLVALRGHPSMLKYMGNALYFAIHGSFSERTLQRFPTLDLGEAANELAGASTQEGAAVAQYHYAMANSAGRNWLIPERLKTLGLSDTYKNRIIAAGDLNMRFTRAITRFQKGVVFLDGAAKALKDGTKFYADEWVPREPSAEGSLIDAQGRPTVHSVTGHRIHDKVRSEHPMTPAEAHNEGMKAVAEVMGDLRHMTPLERNLLIRVFPFYGWTKHILQYVMTYPFDHPWRAMILSNLAMMDVQDQASGLPIRLQLLTFLGQPDQFGNVTAIDTKALDPLRDTANYASLTGLFESLNPAITGVGALVDPQISFAGQNAYPQVTFNQLYGISTAGAGGNVWNAAEQFVPQLTALDSAFNLSGQYAYLKNASPTQFSKKVFESLGLPFTPQELNLRQMAAQEEIDRYRQAAAAAYQVATTGNLAPIAGYPANAQLPDPLNTQYNVTPAYLAALTAESEKQTGLPFYETTRPPPNPVL